MYTVASTEFASARASEDPMEQAHSSPYLSQGCDQVVAGVSVSARSPRECITMTVVCSGCWPDRRMETRQGSARSRRQDDSRCVGTQQCGTERGRSTAPSSGSWSSMGGPAREPAGAGAGGWTAGGPWEAVVGPGEKRAGFVMDDVGRRAPPQTLSRERYASTPLLRRAPAGLGRRGPAAG